MSENAEATTAQAAKLGWFYWAVAGLSLLWNAFGALDYVMTQTNNQAYLAAFTEAQRAYFQSFPAWMEAAWALGVWGAVAGSILLLARSRWAVIAFAGSLFGLFVSTVWQFGLSETKVTDIMPPEAMIMTVVIWIIAIALLFYARLCDQRGLLR
jgi:hypothetical protein